MHYPIPTRATHVPIRLFNLVATTRVGNYSISVKICDVTQALVRTHQVTMECHRALCRLRSCVDLRRPTHSELC